MNEMKIPSRLTISINNNNDDKQENKSKPVYWTQTASERKKKTETLISNRMKIHTPPWMCEDNSSEIVKLELEWTDDDYDDC